LFLKEGSQSEHESENKIKNKLFQTCPTKGTYGWKSHGSDKFHFFEKPQELVVKMKCYLCSKKSLSPGEVKLSRSVLLKLSRKAKLLVNPGSKPLSGKSKYFTLEEKRIITNVLA
jgi:hypothetical protein